MPTPPFLCLALWLAAVCAGLPSALAQDSTEGGASDATSAESALTCSANGAGNPCAHSGVASVASGSSMGVGNPIHVVSGNKHQMEVDMAALPGELGLEVVRHYNSHLAEVDGPMGHGWRLSYDTRLYRVGQTLQILQADGQRHVLSRPPGQASAYTGRSPLIGQVWLDRSPMAGHRPTEGPRYRWVWTHGPAAGRVLHFNGRGQLERIVAASGATVRLVYAPDGALTQVHDPLGRRLDLYPETPAAPSTAMGPGSARVARIDTPHGPIRYTYEAQNLLEAATAHSLTRYRYDHPLLPSHLTALRQSRPLSDTGPQAPPIRESRWTYPRSGVTQSSDHTGLTVTVQRVRTASRDIEGLSWVRWRDTSAPNAAEGEALYRHRLIAGQARITEAVGHSCPGCSPSGWRYRYDAEGEAIERTRLSVVPVVGGRAQGQPRPLEGIRHLTQRDATGRVVARLVLRVVYRAGQEQGTERLERRVYADPRWPDKPTAVERPSVVPGLAQRWALAYNEAGQLTEWTQMGHSPLTAQGPWATDAGQAQTLHRTVRWTYTRQSGVSVLQNRTGPLADDADPLAMSAPLSWAPRRLPPASAATVGGYDDFGRRVWRQSASHGEQWMAYDAADRLVGMQDAMGHRATYRYDPAGRIRQQDVWTPGQDQAQTTRWHYQGPCLVWLEHPVQSERYGCNEQGQRLYRDVQIAPDATAGTAAVRALTREAYNPAGQQIETTWPDGSRLEFLRDAHGRLTAVRRQRIGTRWLAALAPARVLMEQAQYDLQVLAGYRSGNGIQTRWERSPHQAHRGQWHRIAHTRATNVLLERDHHWAPSGELLATDGQRLGQSEQTAHAYNRQGQLLLSVHRHADSGPKVWRYAYDGQQRRRLAQQGVDTQNDHGHTLALTPTAAASDPPSHRLRHLLYNPNGQVVQWRDLERPDTAHRALRWDALGRLVEVSDETGLRVRYRHDHRGLRIARTVDTGQAPADQPLAETQHFLYDGQHAVQAELDGQGRVRRWYVWLSAQDTGLGTDWPLALIDPVHPQTLPSPDPLAHPLWQAIRQAARDVGLLVRLWLGGADEQIVWLHSNHLGAPELATEANGQAIWSAHYSPFGEAEVHSPTGLALALRLPGQWRDPATGWHDNRQRVYDPALGQYLSPDPLGHPDGPNPYAYAAYNPLRFVDPDGLILFAFDGTGNDESRPDQLSNVVHFRNLYASDGGQSFYMTGPGTTDPRSGIHNPWYLGGHLVDMAVSLTGKKRIAYLIEDLNRLSDGTPRQQILDIDVVGFSRGAAQARDFANQLSALTQNGWYHYLSATGLQSCQQVNFRFLGLWDTVLSVPAGGYALDIPADFAHVAHAVALNEYRSLFPVESIARAAYGGPSSATASALIERGFVGSHSDIGGSFVEGDLAKVALVWMVNQALAAGVDMRLPGAGSATVVSAPALHDKSSNLYASHGPAPTPDSEDRKIYFGDGSSSRQRPTLIGEGTGYADTLPFIRYHDWPQGHIAGTVDMHAYLDWLHHHGYGIDLRVQ
jgi:RHS repeat-associated protein